MNSGGKAKSERRVSIASKDVLDIEPIVYSFKGPPQHGHASGSIITAARPPQWLYHDHVMGVIWMIFHKEKNYVGISQLHWCLTFLMDLKNSQGEYTGDVDICIQAIQDDLIEQYAKLGPALEKSKEEKSLRKENESPVAAQDIRSAVNEETRNNVDEDETLVADNESREFISAEFTDSTNNNNNNDDEPEVIDESFITAQSQGITGTSTPKEEEPQTSKLNTKSRKKDSEKRCDSTCSEKGGTNKKEEKLSLTYNEMVSRGAAPCTQPYIIQDTYNDQLYEYTEGDQGNKTDMNSVDIFNYLNSSKQLHMESITKNVETLRILERLLGNINTSGIASNNAQGLTSRLEVLENQDVIQKTEETPKD